jgi:hypothetical protein
VLAGFFQESRWEAQRREALAEWAHREYAWENLAPCYLAFYEGVLRAAGKGRGDS